MSSGKVDLSMAYQTVGTSSRHLYTLIPGAFVWLSPNSDEKWNQFFVCPVIIKLGWQFVWCVRW